jgi:single-strand DNA-binding protein
MNNVVLIGRLVRDPELKFIPSSGMAVANFTLAVDKEMSKDKKSEMQAQGKPTADFIPVVVFGKIAETCANFLAKGRMTAVNGRIQTRTYTNNAGDKRYITEVLASRVEFIDWGDKNKTKQQSDDSFPDFSDEDIFQPTDDDDIPF